MTQPDDTTTVLLLIGMAILPVFDLASTLFFGWLFWRSKRDQKVGVEWELATRRRFALTGRVMEGRSWLLAMLTFSFAVITVIFVYFGFLSARRLLGFESINTVALSSALLLILGTIPIMFAISFWRSRRKRGSPPPFGEHD